MRRLPLRHVSCYGDGILPVIGSRSPRGYASVASLTGITKKACVGACGERCLEGKVLLPIAKLVDSVEHDPTRLQSTRCGCERREPLSNQVGIDELLDAEGQIYPIFRRQEHRQPPSSSSTFSTKSRYA